MLFVTTKKKKAFNVKHIKEIVISHKNNVKLHQQQR